MVAAVVYIKTEAAAGVSLIHVVEVGAVVITGVPGELHLAAVVPEFLFVEKLLTAVVLIKTTERIPKYFMKTWAGFHLKCMPQPLKMSLQSRWCAITVNNLGTFGQTALGRAFLHRKL